MKTLVLQSIYRVDFRLNESLFNEQTMKRKIRNKLQKHRLKWELTI